MTKIIHVQNIINQWDPIGLMDFCPRDEYHTEIESIVTRVNENLDYKALGMEIYKIFLESFGEECFKKSLSDCVDIAKNILNFPFN